MVGRGAEGGGVHAKPLHSKRQFITAWYILYHYVLLFDARSQQ